LILHSYAKVNLYLRVLDKREDGFHSLITLFERIDLSDRIILTPLPGRKITLSCNRKDLACDSSNLAYRSARLLQDTFNVPCGVEIKLIKKIPIGSGMGGGSSNAASVLLGLNRLWRLRLTTRCLADLGAQLGSDVPFFVYNIPFAAATGKGEHILPLSGLRKTRLYHFLAVPRLHVSTPVIYRKWDELNSFALTSHDCRDILNGVLSIRSLTQADNTVKFLISALKKKQRQGLSRCLFNSLEEPTFSLYPEVFQLKEKLRALGTHPVLMSGSGPAVFCLVSSRKEGMSLWRKIKKENRNWQFFLTRTV